MDDRGQAGRDAEVVSRAGALYEAHRLRVFRGTDHLFAGMLFLQWIAGIAAALVIAPRAWDGSSSRIHENVLASVFLGAAIVGVPILMALVRPGVTLTRHVIAAGQMLMGALLIHLTGGRIETHFHVFGSLAFLAFYRDWRVLLTATCMALIDHVARGLFWPRSVYGVLTAEPWRWIEHAGWVVFEDAFLIPSCVRGMNEIGEMADRRAELEITQARIEATVAGRTAELREANARLSLEVDERSRAEASLRGSEARKGGILQTALDAIIMIDHEGRVIEYNPAAERIFGYSREEAVGHRVAELIIPKLDRAAHGAGLARFLQTGRSELLGRRFETSAVRRDGVEIPVELAISSIVIDGPPIFAAHLRDISERKRAERELKNSQAVYSSLVENLPQQVFRKDVTGRYTFANLKFCASLGLGPADLIGRTDHSLVGGDLAARQAVDDQRVIESGQLFETIERAQSPDGRSLSLRVTKVPIRGDDGRPIGLQGMIEDVTERIRAEEALRESERQHRILFEGNPQPMWVFDLETLRFLAVNDAAIRAYGYSRVEFLAMTIEAIRPEAEIERLRAFLTEGMTTEPGKAEFWKQRKKDGTVFDARITHGAIEFAGRRCLMILAHDVTDMLRTSRALRESEERYALAVEGSNDGIWDWECGTGHVYFSPRFKSLIGFEGGDLPELIAAWEASIHPDDRDHVVQAVKDHLAGVPPYGVEYRLRVKSGEYRWFHARGQAIWGDSGRATRMAGSLSDVTDRRRAEEEIHDLNARLEARLKRIAALRRIDQAISGSLDLGLTLDVCLDQAMSQLDCDAAAILLFDAHTQTLQYVAEKGLRLGTLRGSRSRLGDGPASRVVLSRDRVTILDLAAEASVLDGPALVRHESFTTYHAVPLVAKGQVKGVLELYHREPVEPEPEWLDFLDTLGGQTAIAIDNSTLFDGLQRSNLELKMAYDATIEGWSRALDLRDKETEGHTRRVTELTLRLAESMGFSGADLVNIRRGALLHDIGKMGIPDNILLKPGPLTDEEWTIMRRHPVYALEMLSPIAFLRPALDIPYAHHEKWDGSGYPRGLKAEEIPLSARIFAAVDIWDALRSDRPYRRGWPVNRVREHIRSLSGTHLDCRVVAAFLEIVPSEEEVVEKSTLAIAG